MIEAWHFTGETLRDGRPLPPDGEWLEHDGELKMCVSGLHASRQIIDALRYAPGYTACRVTCDGEILEAGDKLVCSRRRIEWRIDGEGMLRDYARWCAWQVLEAWNTPGIVRRWLTTGDQSIRAAAFGAATGAVRSAAYGAAWSAARSAARSAAYSAASCAEAWSAARSAAYSAASCAEDRGAYGEEWYAACSAAREKQDATLSAWAEAAHRGEYHKWEAEE